MRFVLLSLSILLLYITATENVQASKHSHSDAKGYLGHSKGQKYEEHGHEKSDSSKSKHDVERAKKGQSTKFLHKVEDEEGGGKKHKHHSEDSHASSKKSGGGSQHGLKYEEGSKRKKANYKRVLGKSTTKTRKKITTDSTVTHIKAENIRFTVPDIPSILPRLPLKSKEEISRTRNRVIPIKNLPPKREDTTKKDQSGYKGKGEAETHHQKGKKWGKKGSSHGGKQYHFGGEH